MSRYEASVGLPICKERISDLVGGGPLPQDRELKIGLHEEKCAQVVEEQAQSQGPDY